MQLNGPMASLPAEEPAVTEVAAVDSSRVSTRLREIFLGRRLSPAQRRIARYLLHRGDEVVFLTSIDIAKAVGVSQPSVTRFAYALGFDGFPEFREQLRDSLRADGTTGAGGGRNSVQQLIDSEVRGLQALAEELTDLTGLERVGAALAGSRPLVILGLRVSAPLARYVGHFTAKVMDVRVLEHAGSPLIDQLTRAADAGASWVLAVALPRYPRDLLEALEWARTRGLKIALLTDQPIGPVADLADEILTAPVSRDLTFDSQAVPTVVCAALLQAILDALPLEQQARLDEFELVAARRRTFLAD